MLNNKRGNIILDFIAMVLTVLAIIFYSIILKLTVNERVYNIENEFKINDLNLQVFSYLRTPYENGDVAEGIMTECENNGDFSKIKSFTDKLNLPSRMKLKLECNNKNFNIKGTDCDESEIIELIGLDENLIKINYC